jgi:monovalent cation/proton antiporter MnhG/PhaG subunit
VSPVDLTADVLLALGVAGEICCVAGLFLMRTTYDRLHYAAASTIVGPAPIAAAIALRETFPQSGGVELGSGGIAALLTALLVIGLNPILTHATARAARLRERGTLDPRAHERRAP